MYFNCVSRLCRYVANNIIGHNFIFSGPFGQRRVVYCDYTASGRALKCFEDYIVHSVLPSYGNTHTTTSFCSQQTTRLREEARDILRRSVGGSEQEDAVIFVGSGTTGAVHKLIGLLDLMVEGAHPIIFVGATEHHSNLLPWREIPGAQIIRIQENNDGLLDLEQLEEALVAAVNQRINNSSLMIGCFSAASNITGTLNRDLAVTALLHRFGALSFWDYATAAPYVNIEMNPSTSKYPCGQAYKDALYFSPHKFVGGVETPGVLIVKKALLRNQVPHCAGGGTVVFVDRNHHRYLSDAETREEGGTPSIVGSIRIGLIFKLKSSFTAKWIMEREETLVRLAINTWKSVPELILLGSQRAHRLAIFSFLVRHPDSGFYLHHNFVCKLLNDLYGIQARGGCACAGPYAQDLLNIDDDLVCSYNLYLYTLLCRQHFKIMQNVIRLSGSKMY